MAIKILKMSNFVKDEEEMEPLYIVGRHEKWCNHVKKTIWKFLIKLNVHLYYDAVISLLAIYSKGIKLIPTTSKTDKRMIIAALFIRAKVFVFVYF